MAVTSFIDAETKRHVLSELEQKERNANANIYNNSQRLIRLEQEAGELAKQIARDRELVKVYKNMQDQVRYRALGSKVTHIG